MDETFLCLLQIPKIFINVQTITETVEEGETLATVFEQRHPMTGSVLIVLIISIGSVLVLAYRDQILLLNCSIVKDIDDRKPEKMVGFDHGLVPTMKPCSGSHRRVTDTNRGILDIVQLLILGYYHCGVAEIVAEQDSRVLEKQSTTERINNPSR